MSRNATGPVMLDIAGQTLTALERSRLSHPNTGGLILFARNFSSRAQLARLMSEVREVAGNILVAVDHEGGRVQRFKTDGFTHVAAMARIGERFDHAAPDAALEAGKLAFAAGYVLAAELRACDIDLTFAPVFDLHYGSSAVIGDRAFHRDPRVVAWLAQNLMHGFSVAGMANCAKHFPGHGFVSADSHIDLPIDERAMADVTGLDMAPYRWLSSSVAAVMPAHVVYPAVDPRAAGFSPVWLKDILRGQLGYGGAIFSDDLSMEGASVAGDVCAGARAALDAGCDMVLVCNAPEKAQKVLSDLPREKRRASMARIEALKPVRRSTWKDLASDWRYLHSKKTLLDAQLVLN